MGYGEAIEEDLEQLAVYTQQINQLNQQRKLQQCLGREKEQQNAHQWEVQT